MRAQLKRDEGFTLIEVIIAVALLMGASVAVGAFVIQGMRLAAQQQRTQVAVTVATERMDEVQRLIPTTSTTDLATLVKGRVEATVEDAWNTATGVTGLENTYPAWGTAGDPGTDAAIPVYQTTTRSGSDYESTVLIGTCYQPLAGGLCTTLPGSDDTDPGPTSPLALSSSQLVRVFVIVDYTGNCDGGDTCRYTTSGLFDTKGDLTWRTD